ncbi:Biopolymer transport protein, ExbD/TolR family [Sulfurovum sp. enrichment culture clone C5]|uniref:Biopolymer transport protein, ExbD/TolR family n=1 Tax=Sulfurovum sp. enrichment culture clone C5 TaxID=497650 RepID=A0A0S4XPA9_9BACT|nr:Biopolymer transport protein, ExbD/TolR family [Sulfurovum sp. enrichment culture clone C5]
MFNWDDDPDLNITPLMDVMLVLMAVLMIAAPTITYQEQIKLPDGSKTTKSQKLDSVTIRMDKTRKVYIDDNVYEMNSFSDYFSNKDIDKNSSIYIRADESLAYKDIMDVLKDVKKAGFLNVSLITE